MADFSKVKIGSGMVAAAVVAALMIAVAHAVALQDGTCSTADTSVYTYWSFCNSPALLSTWYHYVPVSASSPGGGLEPEYDESNSTYYVRLTGSSDDLGATYIAVVANEESGTLLVNSTVYIYNADSGRVLQWRKESTDEYFLIEQEDASAVTEGAPFRFLQAEGVLLPCPLIYPPAQCQAYYLVSDPDSSAYTNAGLLAYEEGGATYIKAAPAGSTGDLPLTIIKSSSAASSSATPFPTIRSVTGQ